MLDHLQACGHCPRFHYDPHHETWGWCTVYKDTSWVNRRGGCPGFPYREIPRARGEYVDGEIMSGSQRPGQQKQKKVDRKYDNRKARKKYGRYSQ